MTKLMLDSATLAKFPHLAEPIEVCDESGKTVGYFHRVAAPIEPRSSDAEIRRRMHQRSGRTLKEILADLEKNA